MGNCCGSTATVPSEPPRPTPQTQPEPSHPASSAPQTNHQTSKSSLVGSYQMSSVASSSHRSSEKHRGTVQGNGETRPVMTPTSPSKPRAPTTPSRALSQDSSQTHRHGTVNMSSWGDVLASQDSRHQGTFPQPPGPMNRRRKSENVLGNGHTSQFGSFLTQGAGQTPPEGQESRPRFPPTLQGLLLNDFRYAVGRCPISP